MTHRTIPHQPAPHRTMPRTVGDVMTADVTTLDENDSLEHLLEAMHSLHYRHTPVVDGDRVIGMLSERDVLRYSASSLLPHGTSQTAFLERRFRVRDVMTREVETVRPSTPLKEAAERMLALSIDSLPVVDDAGALVGIVTSSDLVRVVRDLAPAT